MEKDQIKSAFSRVKKDIIFLNNEIGHIRNEISEIKILLKSFHEDLNTKKLHEIAETNRFFDKKDNQTLRQINSTHTVNTTDTSTVPQEIEGLKHPNSGISIGNEGASTDRQTDRQTDTSTHISSEIPSKTIKKEIKSDIETNIQEASEILDSLDALKKEIRLKFKRITQQEMLVFSTIYQLEEQNPNNNTYKYISQRLNLSESSIRDYVQRMINKGIPIKKQKINNKKLRLSISSELKKIASLPTIIRLREL